MKMSYKWKKSAVTFTVLLTAAGIAFASCGGTEALVVASVAQMAGKVVESIGEKTAQILQADEEQTEKIVSSLKVLAKQIESSANKNGAVMVQAEQASAAVARQIADKELIDKVVVDFMSQGFDPCGQSAATKKLALAERSVRASIPERIKNEIDAGGGKYQSVAETLTQREKQHQALFCTQDEVDSGVCSKLGKVPGGDTNASLLFSSDKSAEMVAAKNAVINNIIGLPDNPLPSDMVHTPVGYAYVMEKKKKDAFLAFSVHSLKSIQAENEEFKQVMDDRVGQYFGTPKATEWAKSQAAQAERGIIVDLLKIQGLALKIRERKIRENLRTEANLAALIELDNQRINGALTQNAAAQVQSSNAAAKVR